MVEISLAQIVDILILLMLIILNVVVARQPKRDSEAVDKVLRLFEDRERKRNMEIRRKLPDGTIMPDQAAVDKSINDWIKTHSQ